MNRRKEIKKWLLDKDLTVTAIAKEVGVSIALVSYVIKGTRNNKRVIQYLLDQGCPENLFSL